MRYLASYDLESVEACVEAARAVTGLHRRLGLPATFFVVGRCLEEHGPELRGILDDPLFDLQSHTLSHALLTDSHVHGAGVEADLARREIAEGVRLVREVLGAPCEGLRSPCGFDGGFKGHPHVLEACAEAGLKYVSSDARGPGDSLPAPLKEPYTYAEDGYPGLWELPVHGWHDNVLKGFARNVPFIIYPFGQEWHVPKEFPKTPRAQADHHLVWIDEAQRAGLPFVSLALHPWSLIRYDPELREEEMIFEGLAERGIEVVTATEAWRGLAEGAR
jgi:peptidoglycan/xylan/chitin deacetylase (PgdA/CDA1 family)